jgi:hypothetical protein
MNGFTSGDHAAELAHQVADRVGDYLAAADELSDLLDGPESTEAVLFHWSTEHGTCYECGLPAAFYLPDAYGMDSEGPTEVNKRCAVCAANDAAEGERVARIASLDEEGAQ